MKLLLLGFSMILLTGCTALGEIAETIPGLDASSDIAAVSTLTSDFVNQPWDNILQVGIGYALCLLRRMYKKKKGAK